MGSLQLQVTKPTFDTWLRRTTGIALEGQVLSVEAPTPFAVGWLERRMYQIVLKTLARVNSDVHDVQFLVAGGTSPDSATEPASEGHPVTVRPSFRPQFNGRFTFANFVEGTSNQLALNAARAVAEAPGQIYNPLFIYAGVGLGKTHLLHAIGHSCLERGTRVFYVTSEQFTNEFIHGIRTKTSHEFRSKYQNTDVLLIDDIQFIGGKERTQEGFFHTFNELYISNRQIVLTSDCPPKALALLQARLKSRFESGLIADIQVPSLQTKIDILRIKSECIGISLEAPVLEFVAHKINGNVRELEGCINRLAALSRGQCSPITMDLARRAMVDQVPSNHQPPASPQDLFTRVEHHFGIPHQALIGRSRTRKITTARHLVAYLLREELGLGYSEIGALLGGRDHSTVIHAVTRIQGALATDPQLHQDLLSTMRNGSA